MLKIALCDDNSKVVSKYAALISQICEKNQLEAVLSCFDSGETLLFHYVDAPEQLDILYLDILMGKTDGMKTAQKLRECGCKAQIIFLTSCEDYVYDAFDVNASQYLLKDEISAQRFEEIFLKAAALACTKKEELFTFEFDGETNVIAMGQISYFEIWQRLVTVHYSGGKTAKFYASMEQLEKQLRGKDFARVHRSFLVHLPYITRFQHQGLLLKTGETIPVGGTYAQPLKRIFSDYIARLHIYSPQSETETGQEK